MIPMKKIITAALALVLTLGMSVTAFAASSVTVSQPTAKDSNGNAVAVTVSELTTATKEESVSEAQTRYGVAPLWSKDINVAGASATNPITITIPVAGVNSGDTIVVLHKRSTDNVWEVLSGVAGNGTVAVTVTSCSPFAVVRTATATAAETTTYSPEWYEEQKALYNGNATSDTAATSAVSPKTADNGVLGLTVIAMTCAAALLFVPRKKNA